MATDKIKTNAGLFVFTLDEGKIKLQTSELERATKAFVGHVQTVLVNCALFAAVNGRITLMQDVYDKLGPAWHRNTLVAWAIKNGPFGWRNKDKDKPDQAAGFTFNKEKAAALKAEYEADPKACSARLMGIAWETAKREPDFEGFDLMAVLKRAVSKADKTMADADKSKHPRNKIDPDLLDKVRKLVAEAALEAEANDDGGMTPPPVGSGESAVVVVH